MKIFRKFLSTAISMLLIMSYSKITSNLGVGYAMGFGKSFDVKIGENEIIDAQYLQKVLDETVVKDVPYFDMLGNDELKKMITYMGTNNLMIAPGTYTINQGWIFEDGLFNVGDKKQEVIKFKAK